ncbi:MAG: RdgB/HAM1 family non-canonical purine NTP pyrophosphatase [Actinomycetota bacterium]
MPGEIAEVVLASTNPGKIAEVSKILGEMSIRLLTREAFEDWPEIEETGASYLENALIKAHALLAFTGRPALADDSGIEVDVLGGRPGVRSARFAGPGATDEENNRRLISLLKAIPPELRSARYRCVAAMVFPDGTELAGVGACEGRIGFSPRGCGGFGYDPWFIPAGDARTMAELRPEEKHAISHRGKALRGLASLLGRSAPAISC